LIKRAWAAYRLRIKRRRFLLRAWRKSKQLRVVRDQTTRIARDDLLVFATLRNEIQRLPYWLKHYRALGVDHFLIVDNDSDDGSRAYLEAQPDVSLWTTDASYKLSRFGMDWLTWLQMQHAHGHWALTVDADELLVYPDVETQNLKALTCWLETQDIPSFGALMLDLYPKGALSKAAYTPGEDPTKAIPYFDADNYRHQPNTTFESRWIQGGVRERVFFQSRPERAPTLNKVPLVNWKRHYAYVTSTHHMLPRKLNHAFGIPGQPTGVLLHTKFLNTIGAKSAEELERKQHFENSALYQTYYETLIEDPDFWTEASVKYENAAQLTTLGLMSGDGWSENKPNE
jgi:hypothetical protein